MPTSAGFYVTLAAIILIAGLFLYQHEKIGHLDQELTTLQTQNDALGAANQACKITIDEQNKAIVATQKLAQQREQQAADAEKAAGQTMLQYAARVQAREKDITTGDVCKATQNIFNDYFKGLQP